MNSINKIISATLFCSAVALITAKVVAAPTPTTTLVNGKIAIVQVEKDLSTSIRQLAQNQDQWFTYRVTMEANNGMPCCYGGQTQSIHHRVSIDDEHRPLECHLNKQEQNYGSIPLDKKDSSTLDVYIKYHDHQPMDLFYVGSACQVDADNNRVYQLTDIDQAQSVQFLSQLITKTLEKNDSDKTFNHRERLNEHLTHSALAAIAYHHGSAAQNWLEKTATGQHKKLVHDAIFWLGEARNKAGYQALVKLLDDATTAKSARRHAVFALSENHYEKAAEKLVQLAETPGDDLLQGEAIFWLAQTNKITASKIIPRILSESQSQAVREKAIFALTEIDNDESWQQLILLATEGSNKHDREQAIFWLSQGDRIESGERDSSQLLLQLANKDPSQAIRDKAIFALSQLPHKIATPALLSLLKDASSRQTKKQALFWLGQSDDLNAIRALENILNRENN